MGHVEQGVRTPVPGTDPGIMMNNGARCQVCLVRDVMRPATHWHPVRLSLPVCARHAGCTCTNPDSSIDRDPTCPVHTRRP